MSPKLSNTYTVLIVARWSHRPTKRNGFWIGNTGVCQIYNKVTHATSIIVRSVLTPANNFTTLWCWWQPCCLLNYVYWSQHIELTDNTSPWYLQPQAKRQHSEIWLTHMDSFCRYCRAVNYLESVPSTVCEAKHCFVVSWETNIMKADRFEPPALSLPPSVSRRLMKDWRLHSSNWSHQQT